MARSLRWISTATAALVCAAAALVWASTAGTLGGFTAAKVANSQNSVTSAVLGITHSQGSCTGTSASSPVACTSTVLPATATTAGASQTDTITNSGTVTPTVTTERVRMLGCAPVDLANTGRTAATGVMLPRTGMSFNPTATDGPNSTTGYLTDNGSGYASNIVSSTEPAGGGPLVASATYGMGVWFRTTSGSGGGPLFGFGTSATNSAGFDNRILYLTALGKIGFLTLTGGLGATSVSSTAYNDNSWHFVYVTLTVSTLVVTSWTARVYVDGTPVASATGSGAPTSVTGYWHLGWSPISSYVSAANYFTGSLADFMVDNSGSASALSTALTSTAASQSEFWALNDSGGGVSGTSLTGTLPSSTSLPGNSVPCSDVTTSWSMTSPGAAVTSGTTLTNFVAAGWITLSAGPAVGAGQNSSITLTRINSTGDPYASGLILYAPVQFDYTVGSWDLLMSYTAPAAGTATTSCVVIG